MGSIGIGAAARPVGAGRAQARRRRVVDSGDGDAIAGGGDIRAMRKVGGYSAVGFRTVPPIGRGPVRAEEDSVADAAQVALDRELAAIDRELAAAARELAADPGARETPVRPVAGVGAPGPDDGPDDAALAESALADTTPDGAEFDGAEFDSAEFDGSAAPDFDADGTARVQLRLAVQR